MAWKENMAKWKSIEFPFSSFSKSQTSITFQFKNRHHWSAAWIEQQYREFHRSRHSTHLRKWFSSWTIIDWIIRGIGLLFKAVASGVQLGWKNSIDKKAHSKPGNCSKSDYRYGMNACDYAERNWMMFAAHRITLHQRLIEMHRNSISNMILRLEIGAKSDCLTFHWNHHTHRENDTKYIGHTFISCTHKLFVSFT